MWLFINNIDSREIVRLSPYKTVSLTKKLATTVTRVLQGIVKRLVCNYLFVQKYFIDIGFMYKVHLFYTVLLGLTLINGLMIHHLKVQKRKKKWRQYLTLQMNTSMDILF